MKSYKTTLLRGISVSVLSLFGLVSSASAQGPLYTFRADGEFANVYRYEPTASGCKDLRFGEPGWDSRKSLHFSLLHDQ
jgi:hypothetical protein